MNFNLFVAVGLFCVIGGIDSRQVATADSKFHDDRVVGGKDASPHEFPWIVTIVNRAGGFCAGSIVAPEWVITAAHCNQANPDDYTVTAGRYDLERHTDKEQQVRVVQKYTHPVYISYSAENDIALMRVDPPFKFNNAVKPINMAPSGYEPEGETVVSGWGLTSEDAGEQPNILQKVTLPLVDKPTCNDYYNKRRGFVQMMITETVICAGSLGRSACFGDSGGPLHCKSGSNPIGYICGTVSGGKKCGDVGVYQSVSAHHDWITKTMAGLYTEDPLKDDTDEKEKTGSKINLFS